MAVQTQYGTDQLTQVFDLIKQHRSAIRNVFGTSGTGFEKTNWSEGDYLRLQNSIKVNQQQAQLIATVWPLYVMGYEDGSSSNFKANPVS